MTVGSNTATPLAPAEALVLLDPNGHHGRAAVKVTLMHLMMRRLITVEQHEQKVIGSWTHKTQRISLSRAASLNAIAEYERAILEALENAPQKKGYTTMSEMVLHLQKRFSVGFEKIQRVYIIPSLVERGLLEAHYDKVLGVFPRTRYHTTERGAAIVLVVQEQMTAARSIPDYLDNDPAQAAALALAAGSALLLVEEMKSHYRKLAEVMRGRSEEMLELAEVGAGMLNDIAVIGDGDYADGFASLNDLGLAALDAAAFGAIDGAFDSFDGGFDASGGGDGGGGGD